MGFGIRFFVESVLPENIFSNYGTLSICQDVLCNPIHQLSPVHQWNPSSYPLDHRCEWLDHTKLTSSPIHNNHRPQKRHNIPGLHRAPNKRRPRLPLRALQLPRKLSSRHPKISKIPSIHRCHRLLPYNPHGLKRSFPGRASILKTT